MMKKLIVTSSLVACSLTFAASAPMMASDPNPFSGFRIGAGVGGDALSFHTDYSYLGGDEAQTTSQGTQLGVLGQLNLGYDQAIENWVIGGELFANLSSIKSKHNQDLFGVLDYGDELTDRYDLGADIRGGYRWNKNLFYVLAGPEFSQFKYKSTIGEIGVGGDTVTTNRNLTGLLLGAGVEQALTTHLRLREQVTYTMYPNMHFQSGSAADATTTTAKFSSISRLGAMLGLAYQF